MGAFWDRFVGLKGIVFWDGCILGSFWEHFGSVVAALCGWRIEFMGLAVQPAPGLNHLLVQDGSSSPWTGPPGGPKWWSQPSRWFNLHSVMEFRRCSKIAIEDFQRCF